MTTNEAREKRKAELEAKIAMITKAAMAACGTFSTPNEAEVQAAVRYYLANPEDGVAAYHEQWVERRRRGGWLLDDQDRDHVRDDPRMTSFFRLPRQDALAAHLIRGIVKALDR